MTQSSDISSRLKDLVKALVFEKEYFYKSNGETARLNYYKKLLEMINLE